MRVSILVAEISGNFLTLVQNLLSKSARWEKFATNKHTYDWRWWLGDVTVTAETV